MFIVYILYSATLAKYYVGFTSMSLDERLSRHLCEHGGFTSKAKDWKVVHFENYQEKSEAIKKELFIKKRNIKKYLRDIGLII
ncbi:MAG: GIY-YIG nuclease family protein [Saprospiraceae bacterium]|nr:GIY-YIG nuclease family protein [Saprospiraceae bacterium]MBP6523621.1 GIY-YIG nuclease family protein [Saprospiraceae bacterium]MBP7306301.1 GIY-YIG nuclease family protein [Saprospiraceae bacterium]